MSDEMKRLNGVSIFLKKGDVILLSGIPKSLPPGEYRLQVEGEYEGDGKPAKVSVWSYEDGSGPYITVRTGKGGGC